MRQPSNVNVVSFRADPYLLKRLTALAAKQERQLADTVRRLVVQALDQKKGTR